MIGCFLPQLSNFLLLSVELVVRSRRAIAHKSVLITLKVHTRNNSYICGNLWNTYLLYCLLVKEVHNSIINNTKENMYINKEYKCLKTLCVISAF